MSGLQPQHAVEADMSATNNDVEKSAAQPDIASSDQLSDGKPDTDDRPPAQNPSLPILDRFLPLFIVLSIVIGLVLSRYVPSFSTAMSTTPILTVPLPLFIGLLVMLTPLLLLIPLSHLPALFRTRTFHKHLLISFILNWLLAPLLMLALAWAFLPDRQDLREGVIFVGVARCIAMVMLWTHLAGGDETYAAVLVVANSLLQVALFAPLAVFYVRVVSRDPSAAATIQYAKVAESVAVFLGAPLGLALALRLLARAALGQGKFDRYVGRWAGKVSLIALLYTIVVLFGSQGRRIEVQITSVLRVAAPLVVYFIVVFGATASIMRWAGYGYRITTTQSFTAASNNFELAIAVVVATYGADSEQALASTVGPLIEVPVLLTLVHVMKWFRKRYGWKD